MQKRIKTLQVEMVLLDDGNWQTNTTVGRANGHHVGDQDKKTGDGEISALDAFSRLLSKRNIELLKLIRDVEPRSVAELARLSGRPKASLMLTLRRLNQFGIVEFDETDGRRKVPRVVCDRLRLEIPLS